MYSSRACVADRQSAAFYSEKHAHGPSSGGPFRRRGPFGSLFHARPAAKPNSRFLKTVFLRAGADRADAAASSGSTAEANCCIQFDVCRRAAAAAAAAIVSETVHAAQWMVSTTSQR